MWKRVVGLIVILGVAYAIYDYQTSPYRDAPYHLVADGGFVMKFKGEDSLRAVMVGFEDERETRRYFGYQARNVKPWYLHTWSICRKPTEAETAQFDEADDLGPGGRLDAACEIDADGDVFIRGWVASVPDL
ncbi:MAG: hypothetical protein R8G60_11750 [Roseovarius pacificus]|nr:hypothetical protein [Roseovarius pacificus]